MKAGLDLIDGNLLKQGFLEEAGPARFQKVFSLGTEILKGIDQEGLLAVVDSSHHSTLSIVFT